MILINVKNIGTTVKYIGGHLIPAGKTKQINIHENHLPFYEDASYIEIVKAKVKKASKTKVAE